ncbi:MAG: hypothetical protein ABIF85_01765 [Nanoarchaeota archaeon]|nr:hypothetical protein [Nanoarchaeota archaeon]MBU4299625.1 hypothetical protein [Nanoarchaeota archaeon]MBU4452615.1 hypothetical protein [Nanoarchaeota archaeon]MCG2723918.1 hypothetical protein [archaeon]
MSPEEFRKQVYDQITRINKKLEGFDRIDATLDRIQGTLNGQSKEFKELHEELNIATNQLYISRITNMPSHDGELTYR